MAFVAGGASAEVPTGVLADRGEPTRRAGLENCRVVTVGVPRGSIGLGDRATKLPCLLTCGTPGGTCAAGGSSFTAAWSPVKELQKNVASFGEGAGAAGGECGSGLEYMAAVNCDNLLNPLEGDCGEGDDKGRKEIGESGSPSAGPRYSA